MIDLRYVKAVKTEDKITGLEYFRVAVNIIGIADKATTLNVFGNESGTKCRKITVQICGGDGQLEELNAIMWEKTYQDYFIEAKRKLPCTTIAEFKKSYDSYNFNVIVYAFDAIAVFCGDTEKPTLNKFKLTQMFVENYKDFYLWLKQEKKD